MAKAQQADQLLIGAALAGAAAFVWSKRQSLFPAAVAPAPAAPSWSPLPSYLPTTPAITAPLVLPAPAPVVNARPPLVDAAAHTVQTPLGPVTTSNLDPRLQGCVVGAGGGYECPNAPAAVVSAAQANACVPVSAVEVDAALLHKPTWARDYAAGRLATTRAAYCTGKGNLAAAQATLARMEQIRQGLLPGVALSATDYNATLADIAAWSSALAGNRSDYLNLTGVTLQ